MHLPKGITLRITLLGWLVTLVTLALFVVVIVPEQKREFELSLESKARGVTVSIRGVAAGAAVSEDYSSVVDQAMQVLSGDQAIDYVVMTKNDGFSIVIDRSNWRIEQLGGAWRPATRTVASSIGTSDLFRRRVFQYAFPFDYSGIQWGWIHIGLSLDAYDQSVRRTYKSTGMLVVLCGAFSLLASLIYAGRMVRPIRILHAAVEKVAQGDLHARANVHSRDEVERLAEAFNGMAATILGRNQILESVSFAATQFLSDGNRDTVLGEVLERVGRAAGASRASVLKMCAAEGYLRAILQREWLSSGLADPPAGWESFPWREEGAQHWIERLRSGDMVPVMAAGVEKPVGDRIAPRIQSTIFVPVVVAGQWWGIIAFDDFVQPRAWGEAERDSLRAVAGMLGASIGRHRVRTALVEAKETLEQRVIERTRELENARLLLTQNLERLDLALECAEEALWDWNIPENRTHYSERWGRMLGFSPEEIGDSVEIWDRLVHPDDLAATAAKLRDHMDGKSASYQAEYRMKTKDGGWRWVRSRGKVVARAADGSPLRVTGTHLDITATKKAEAALLELSREAGMAEIATGVLHNVGNVLNSVNVSTSLVSGRIRESRIDHLVAAINMLEQHAGDLPEFLTKDPKGQRVLPYLAKLGSHFQSERDSLVTELELLSSHVGHIKQIVATQQSYAKVSGLVENVSLSELVDDALRILEIGMVRHGVKVERDFETLPAIAADKHKILQILLNLLRNAKQAVKENGPETAKVIRIRLFRPEEGRLGVEVRDTGVGLPPENLTRIFGHGFTTKTNGHGFGLHSCALAASQMAGSLRAESDGPGRGATFILELPLKCAGDRKEKRFK
ncbi:MAG: PAS domain-containing protein [Acidobacteria bacterium]|nr:PAS domain-containing protein [Acidobacteriota bacterium]